ncbi:DUF5681 domain-containing protein [Tunturiibacter gelidoferens]|uniref:Uncharacterized protein n=1 Tax=Tunturiibacter gelidiferens TaxID=3069689 RepID=A0ACC5P3L6_9BACT|nr:DUF5681 domain-containing protein [Edaphobacter lichenicola]MBB5341444.1 hypothetical protein [Edaphobacter lichenicola]
MSNKNNDNKYKDLSDEMGTDDQQEEIDYGVGYKRPPVHSRFPTGQSGNPKGRPRGRKNLKTIVNQVAWEEVTVTNNGRPSKMPRIEANVRQIGNAGASKASKQSTEFVNLVALYSESEESSATGSTEREQEFLVSLLRRLERQKSQEVPNIGSSIKGEDE